MPLAAWFRQRQPQVQVQLVLDRGSYEPGSTVHGTIVLTCRERVYIKCLDVAVHGFELVRFKERTHGWHEFLPLQPPAFEHQAQRQLCYAGAELLRTADGLRLDPGWHPYKVTWELPACDAEGEALPGTFASKAARVFYYLEVRCWMNSPLGSPPDVRQCFQLHVCQVEREPAWIATRHVTKKCFTNVSTQYLLYAPPAGDVLFGVALERLTWAPGEAVCFDFVAESYSGIEFTRIQVTLVRTISASAPRTNDLERAKHMPLGSSELERLRSAGLASVHKHAFSARHWQVLCEAEEYEGRPAWLEQRRATNTKQQRGALWKQVISLPKPLKGGSQLSSTHGRVRFQLPADLLEEQTVRTARITCCDYLTITLLGRGVSPDKPELWLPFKVAYPSPLAPPAAG